LPPARAQEALTPAQWAEFEALTVTNQEMLDAYPEAKRWYTAPLADDATTGQVRQSRANAPLRAMPLVVLAHGIPFAAPLPGWPSDKMEGIMTMLQEDLAKLVPNAHLRHRQQERAQYPPRPAEVGHRGDPGGGRGGAQPKHVNPRTVNVRRLGTAGRQ
jgi:hypothetical protein